MAHQNIILHAAQHLQKENVNQTYDPTKNSLDTILGNLYFVSSSTHWSRCRSNF